MDPVALPPAVGACAAGRAAPRHRPRRRRADLRLARQRRRLGASGALRARRGGSARSPGRRASRLFQRNGPALGISALPLGPSARDGIRVVDRAAARGARTGRSRAPGPFPRIRQLLGSSRLGTHRGGRPVGRRAGTRALRGAATLARRSPAHCRGSRHDHRRRARAPRGDRHSRDAGAPVRLLRGRQPARAAPAPGERGRLSGHSRQRHRARMVREPRRGGQAPRARLPRRRRERNFLGPDARRPGVRRRARDRPRAGRLRPRRRRADEPSRRGRGQLDLEGEERRLYRRSVRKGFEGWSS